MDNRRLVSHDVNKGVCHYLVFPFNDLKMTNVEDVLYHFNIPTILCFLTSESYSALSSFR